MPEKFVPLGEQDEVQIAQKLREIGDDDAALVYETPGSLGSAAESFFGAPRAWLNTQHQYGFMPRFEGSGRYQPIVAANQAPVDLGLKNQRINLKLDYLCVHDYPRPLISLGDNVHTILFTFEAFNNLPGKREAVAFNQTYRAKSGQDAAVQGYPIFVGLGVGSDGLVFYCNTVNIGNSSDEQLISTLDSKTAKMGLSLLTTAQPALAPFVGFAKSLGAWLASRSKNVPVQEFSLGLDFDEGAPGGRLAIGSYVVAQVERADSIYWPDWGFDKETGAIVRTSLAEGEAPYILPYNAIVFRVSLYEGIPDA